ncbi:MAG: phosphoketolase family protein [Solirubrobacteraceae bacterium]|nr:phosphoketolase family protein [Solirubrobacteraceae bacterium]
MSTAALVRSQDAPLSPSELDGIHRYWSAANYLSVGQIYLLENPLLRGPLLPEHIKPRLLGHWGTTPGLNFIYAHLNRVIRARDLEVLFVAGPGHGGPALVANTYLEGTYSEIYPQIDRTEDGMRRLFRQFSFPGGIPSHAAPQTPGSIHEGGELGYSLAHAYGAAFDHPNLIVACVIGDGEAETGPLAASWHSNKFLSAARDGAVLPILHLNGYKIASPTILARLPDHELRSLLEGYGYRPHFVSGSEPDSMHQLMAATLDRVTDEIADIQRSARPGSERPRWPMIVLRSPKGWTGPKVVDGLPSEGSFRSHQVPLSSPSTNAEHLAQLEAWMLSYEPEELFAGDGSLLPELAALAPDGPARMGSTPTANGGALTRDLVLPDVRDHAAPVGLAATTSSEATRVLGRYLAAAMRLNDGEANLRIFGPDETASNRLTALFEVTDRTWESATASTDDHLAPDGRVMEVLSEHLCEGWLEGYLLSGRHGLLNCYEAFIHIVDSMVSQHAKWLKVSAEVPWRRPVPSLNILLSSLVWHQDHNAISHQDPGFLDHVANKKAGIARIYLPPDANCLLAVADHCLRTRDYVNVIVAGKQPALDVLDIDAAVAHCARGLGIWSWAGTDAGDPDVVIACAGDTPTVEALAATALLHSLLPELQVRFVNVVDLMRLQPEHAHPHGLPDREYDAIFPVGCPVIFAFHGYPSLIHRLTYDRANHASMHVRGYQEEGTTTTPFDMLMLNDMDRFHLVMDVIDRVPGLAVAGAALRQQMVDERLRHRAYTRVHGDDPPSIRAWTWASPSRAQAQLPRQRD